MAFKIMDTRFEFEGCVMKEHLVTVYNNIITLLWIVCFATVTHLIISISMLFHYFVSNDIHIPSFLIIQYLYYYSCCSG